MTVVDIYANRSKSHRDAVGIYENSGHLHNNENCT